MTDCDNSIRKAYEAGQRAASQVVPGARFVGAFGDAAGYPVHGPDRAVFIHAYLRALPPRIRMNESGIIASTHD